jgi:hypothetical protein
MTDDVIYICEITKGLFKGNKVRSVKVGTEYTRKPNGDLQEITQEMYDYWLNECKPFPNPQDSAHQPRDDVKDGEYRTWSLPDKCGYEVIGAV